MNDAAVVILTIKSKFEGRAHAMMATIISGVWGFIEGNIALDEDRPLVGGTDGGLVTTYLRKEGTQAVMRKERRQCEPCKPFPAGTIGYSPHDRGHPHFPSGDPHHHLFQLNFCKKAE